MREEKIFNAFPYMSAPMSAVSSVNGGTAIITGSAIGVKAEAIKALQMFPDADIVAINDSSILTGLIPQHIVSLHWDKIPKWISVMRLLGVSCPDEVISHSTKKTSGIDCAWSFYSLGGGSAGLAVMAMLHMGYDRIILCGCPMDDTDRLTNYLSGVEHNTTKYNECLSFFIANAKALHSLGVRSMSGKTAEALNGTFSL